MTINHIVFKKSDLEFLDEPGFNSFCGRRGVPGMKAWSLEYGYDLAKIIEGAKDGHEAVICKRCIKRYPEIAPLEQLNDAKV
jgi:hypothetical protein